MDIFEAIRNRRSIPKVDPDRRVPRETVEELIELATWAPNHHLTEPWRFHVIAGEERRPFGEALYDALVAHGNAPPEKLARQKDKPFRAPVIVVVSSRPGKDELETKENLYAVAAAIQNMLLGAHARGLGAMWRSGRPAYSPQVATWLGFESGEELMGVIYLGYPACERDGRRARTPADCTVWRGWE